MSDDGNSTQNFLRQIDPGLAKYASEFKKCDVSNLNTLRYLLPSEVNSMEMPQVYKRMVIDKIINMQTPETKSAFKKKMTADASTAASHPPKRLKFENTVSSPGIDVTDAAKSDSGICGSTQNDSYLKKELGRLRDEKETLVILLSHKNDELKDMKKKPLDREPLAIPGNPLTKFTCDNCHYKGHRSMQNKGQKKCPFDPCMGYNHCGLEQKHAEHKHSIVEVNKEICGIQKRLKSIDDEMASIKTFVQHNTTNFISAVRPLLKAHFPHKYIGQKGQQLLQRDLRYIKIACNGKVPAEVSKQQIETLLAAGKSKVSATGVACVNENFSDDGNVPFPKPSASCSTPLNDGAKIDNLASPEPFPNTVPFGMTSPNYLQHMYGSPNYMYVPYTSPQQWGNFYPCNGYMYNYIPQGPSDSNDTDKKCSSTLVSGGAEDYGSSVFPPLPKDSPSERPPLPKD